MSQFIESLLLAIPIPTIFLAENDDETFEVIDGQQRLTTVFSFLQSVYENDEELESNKHTTTVSSENERLKLKVKTLKLTGLETLKELNGNKFTDLDDRIQRKFKNVSLPMIIVKKDSSEEIKYDIFSRINQGSVKLNNQELLNAMYRGQFIKKLNEISELDMVDEIFGRRPVLKKRYGYNEILLRSFIMNEFIDRENWEVTSVPVVNKDKLDKDVRTYGGRLNLAKVEFLKEFRDDSKKAKDLENFVNHAVQNVRVVFGDEAFRGHSESDKATRINTTIAEVQLVVLSRFDTNSIRDKKDEIKDSFLKFLKKDNEDYFLRGTNNTASVGKRYKWGLEVETLLRGSQDGK